MPFLANQPWFISSTKRTGLSEQCESSASGFMSARFTIRTVVGHEGDGQRQQGVLHPEALHRRLLEDEQHALVLRHFLAVHQAGGALLGGLRDLGIDLVHAGGRAARAAGWFAAPARRRAPPPLRAPAQRGWIRLNSSWMALWRAIENARARRAFKSVVILGGSSGLGGISGPFVGGLLGGLLVEAAFLSAAFLSAAFLSAAFLSAAFLSAAFLSACLLGVRLGVGRLRRTRGSHRGAGVRGCESR